MKKLNTILEIVVLFLVFVLCTNSIITAIAWYRNEFQLAINYLNYNCLIALLIVVPLVINFIIGGFIKNGK